MAFTKALVICFFFVIVGHAFEHHNQHEHKHHEKLHHHLGKHHHHKSHLSRVNADGCRWVCEPGHTPPSDTSTTQSSGSTTGSGGISSGTTSSGGTSSGGSSTGTTSSDSETSVSNTSSQNGAGTTVPVATTSENSNSGSTTTSSNNSGSTTPGNNNNSGSTTTSSNNSGSTTSPGNNNSGSTTSPGNNNNSGSTTPSGNNNNSGSTTSSGGITTPGNNNNGGSGSLNIVTGSINIIAVVNVSGNVATVLDLNANIDLEIDFNARIAIAFNTVTGSIQVVNNLQVTGTIIEYIQSLTSVTSILSHGITVAQLTAEQNATISSIRVQLGIDVGVSLENKILQANLTIHLLNGQLRGLYSARLNLQVSQSLESWSSIQVGLAKILGSKSLSQIKGSLDIGVILNQSNGLSRFLVILTQLAQQNDLSTLGLGSITDVGVLLEILVELRSSGDNEIDGLILFIYQIYLHFEGKGSLDAVIEAVINLYAVRNINLSVSISAIYDISGKITVLIQQQQQQFGSQVLSRLHAIFTSISSGSFSIGSFNISEILKIFASGDATKGIQIVVQVIQKLVSGGDASKAINAVIVVITKSLNGTYAQRILANLGLPNVSITTLVHDLSSGSLDNPIIRQISSEFQKVFGGSFSLNASSILQGIQSGFQSWTSGILGLFNNTGGGILGGLIGGNTLGGLIGAKGDTDLGTPPPIKESEITEHPEFNTVAAIIDLGTKPPIHLIIDGNGTNSSSLAEGGGASVNSTIGGSTNSSGTANNSSGASNGSHGINGSSSSISSNGSSNSNGSNGSSGSNSSSGSNGSNGSNGSSGGNSSGQIVVGGTGNITGETGGISINGSGNISGSTGGISISHTGGSNSGSVVLGGGSGSGSGSGSGNSTGSISGSGGLSGGGSWSSSGGISGSGSTGGSAGGSSGGSAGGSSGGSGSWGGLLGGSGGLSSSLGFGRHHVHHDKHDAGVVHHHNEHEKSHNHNKHHTNKEHENKIHHE